MFDPRTLGATCDACPLDWHKAIQPKVLGRAKLAIVCERPAWNEIVRKEFLVGKAGNMVDASLKRLGIDEGEIHKTNALLCPTPADISEKDLKKAVACCRPRLANEIRSLGGALLSGNKALESFNGKTKVNNWHGAPTEGLEEFGGVKSIPTFHLGLVLRSPAYTPAWLMHLKRAYDLAVGILPIWNWPLAVTNHEGPHGGGEGELREALGEVLKANKLTGCDVETAGKDPKRSPLLNVGFANTDLMLSIDWPIRDDKLRWMVAFALKKLPLIFQNGFGTDVPCLVSNGFKIGNYAHDTMVSGAIVHPKLSKALAFMCGIEFHADRWKDEFKITTDFIGAQHFIKAAPKDRGLYNAKDCYMTTVLLIRHLARLQQQVHNGLSLYDTRMKLTRFAVEMTQTGIRANQPKLTERIHELLYTCSEIEQQLDGRMVEAGIDLRDSKGKERFYNPNNSHHVKQLMVALNAPVYKRSKKTGQPSYDEEVLLRLTGSKDQLIRNVAQDHMKYRKHKKYLGTYLLKGSALLKLEDDGRWRSYWNPIATRTGRWGTTGGVAWQTVPKDAEIKIDGKVYKISGLKDIVCAADGAELVECDYSMLELLIIAVLAGDTELVRRIQDKNPQVVKLNDGTMGKLDVHRLNMVDLLGLDPLDVTDTLRDLAKGAVYGMNYGAGAEVLLKTLQEKFPLLTLSDVRRMIRIWRQKRPKLAEWRVKTFLQALEDGFIRAPLSGRQNDFHGDVEETKVLAFPIQMTAADLIDQALIRIWSQLGQDKVIGQIHDSLLGETTDWRRLARLFTTEMERPVVLNGLELSFRTEIKHGNVWGPGMRKAKRDEYMEVV